MHSGPKPCDISLAQRSSPSFCHLQIDFFFCCTGSLGEPGNETNVIPEATLCDPYSAKTF